MSRAITVCHGDFGRLCFVELNRAKVMHAHREGQLLFLISGDDVTCMINEDPVTLSVSRAVAIDSFAPHEVHVASDGGPATLVSVYLNPAWFAKRFPSSDPDWLAFGARSFPVTDSIRDNIDHLVSLVQPPTPDKQPGYHQAIDTRLRHLCHGCFGFPTEAVDSPQDSNPIAKCDARIRKSLVIMNDHVRNDLPLDDIARAAGLSRPHFYRLFRDNLGVTPNVYMNMLRMEFAVERLVYTNQPVTSIALDLGFASQASFTRFFGANQGIPPTDYRRVACIPASLVAAHEAADGENISSQPPTPV